MLVFFSKHHRRGLGRKEQDSEDRGSGVRKGNWRSSEWKLCSSGGSRGLNSGGRTPPSTGPSVSTVSPQPLRMCILRGFPVCACRG